MLNWITAVRPKSYGKRVVYKLKQYSTDFKKKKKKWV